MLNNLKSTQKDLESLEMSQVNADNTRSIWIKEDLEDLDFS